MPDMDMQVAPAGRQKGAAAIDDPGVRRGVLRDQAVIADVDLIGRVIEPDNAEIDEGERHSGFLGKMRVESVT